MTFYAFSNLTRPPCGRHPRTQPTTPQHHLQYPSVEHLGETPDTRHKTSCLAGDGCDIGFPWRLLHFAHWLPSPPRCSYLDVTVLGKLLEEYCVGVGLDAIAGPLPYVLSKFRSLHQIVAVRAQNCCWRRLNLGPGAQPGPANKA